MDSFLQDDSDEDMPPFMRSSAQQGAAGSASNQSRSQDNGPPSMPQASVEAVLNVLDTDAPPSVTAALTRRSLTRLGNSDSSEASTQPPPEPQQKTPSDQVFGDDPMQGLHATAPTHDGVLSKGRTTSSSDSMEDDGTVVSRVCHDGTRGRSSPLLHSVPSTQTGPTTAVALPVPLMHTSSVPPNSCQDTGSASSQDIDGLHSTHSTSLTPRLASGFSSPITHALSVELRSRAPGTESPQEAANESTAQNYSVSLEAPLNALRVHSASALNSLHLLNDDGVLTPSQPHLAALHAHGVESDSFSHGPLSDSHHQSSNSHAVLARLLSSSQDTGTTSGSSHPPRSAAASPPEVSPTPAHSPELDSKAPPTHGLTVNVPSSTGSVPQPSSAPVALALAQQKKSDEAAAQSVSFDSPHDAVACRSVTAAPPETLSTSSNSNEDNTNNSNEGHVTVPAALVRLPAAATATGQPPAPRKLTDLSPIEMAAAAAAAAKARAPQTYGHRAASIAGSSETSLGSIDTVLAKMQGLVPPNTVSGDARGTDQVEEAAALTAAAAALSTPNVPRALRGTLRAGRHPVDPHRAVGGTSSPDQVKSPSGGDAARETADPLIPDPIVTVVDLPPDDVSPVIMTATVPKAFVSPAIKAGMSKVVLLPPEYRSRHAGSSTQQQGGAAGAKPPHQSSTSSTSTIAAEALDDPDAPPQMRRARHPSAKPTKAATDAPQARRTSADARPSVKPTSAAVIAPASEAVAHQGPERHSSVLRRVVRKSSAIIRRIRQPWIRWVMVPFTMLLVALALGSLVAVIVTTQHFIWEELTTAHTHLHIKTNTLLHRNKGLVMMIPDVATMVLDASGDTITSSEDIARRLCIAVARHGQQGFPIGLSYISGVPGEPIVYCGPYTLQGIEGDIGTAAGERTPDMIFVRIIRDPETGLYNGLYMVDGRTFRMSTPPRLVELFPGRRPYTEDEVLDWLGFRPGEVPRNMTFTGETATPLYGDRLQKPRVALRRRGTDMHYTRPFVERLHATRAASSGSSVVSYVSSHVPFDQMLQDAESLLFLVQGDLLRVHDSGSVKEETKVAAVYLVSAPSSSLLTHTPSPRMNVFFTSWRSPRPSLRVLAQRWVIDTARALDISEPLKAAPVRSGTARIPRWLRPCSMPIGLLNNYISTSEIFDAVLCAYRPTNRTALTSSLPSSSSDASASSQPSLAHRPNFCKRDASDSDKLVVDHLLPRTVYWRTQNHRHYTESANSVTQLTLMDQLSSEYDSHWFESTNLPVLFTIILTPSRFTDQSATKQIVHGAIALLVVGTVLYLMTLTQDILMVLLRMPILQAVEHIERAAALIDGPGTRPSYSESVDSDGTATTSDAPRRGPADEIQAMTDASDPDNVAHPIHGWVVPLLARVQVAEFRRLSELCTRMYHRTWVLRQFLPEYFFPPNGSAGSDATRLPPHHSQLPSVSSQSGSSQPRTPRMNASARSDGDSSHDAPDAREPGAATGSSGSNVTRGNSSSSSSNAAEVALNTKEEDAGMPGRCVVGGITAGDGALLAGDRSTSRSSGRRRELLPVLTTVEVPAALRVVSRSPPARLRSSGLASEPPLAGSAATSAATARRNEARSSDMLPLQPPRPMTAVLPVVLQTHAGTLSECTTSPRHAKSVLGADRKAMWHSQCVCSTISIHFDLSDRINPTSPDMSRFLEMLVDTVDKYDVNADILTPEMVSLSVGSRTVVKDHGLVATRCALELFRCTPKSLLTRTTAVVDCGVYNYGVCGVPQHRGFVLWGRPSAELLFKQQQLAKIPFLVTDTVAPLIQSHYRILPIDAAQLVQETDSPHIILYAVYEGSPNSSAWTRLAKQYTEAFQAALDRRYPRTVELLEPLLDSELFPAAGVLLYTLAIQHTVQHHIRHREMTSVEADAAFRRTLARVTEMLRTRPMLYPMGQQMVIKESPIALSWSIPHCTAFMPADFAKSPIGSKLRVGHENSLELWSTGRVTTPSSSSLTNASNSHSGEKRRARSPLSNSDSAHTRSSPRSSFAASTSPGTTIEPTVPVTKSTDVLWIYNPIDGSGAFGTVSNAQSAQVQPEVPAPEGAAEPAWVVNLRCHPADASSSSSAGAWSSTPSTVPSLQPRVAPVRRPTVSLPSSVTDLNRNVWRRGTNLFRHTTSDEWASSFRGMSVNGAMCELIFCRLDPDSEMSGRTSGTGPNTPAETDPTSATPDSPRISRDSLHYMEIVSEAFYHENILQLLSVAVVPEQPYLCLVTEYEPGATIETLLNQYEDSLPLVVLYDCSAAMLRGLDFLHTDKGTCHGLLSPRNVVFGSDGQCKLQAMTYLFGWAMSAPATMEHIVSAFESPEFLSPEVLLGAPKDSASDMYAFGLIVLAMLVGQSPWTWAGLTYGTLSRRSKVDLHTVLQNRSLFAQTLSAGDLALCAYGPHGNRYNQDLARAYGSDKNADGRQRQLREPSPPRQRNRSDSLSPSGDTTTAATSATPTSDTAKSGYYEHDDVLLEVLEACLALDPAERKSAAEVLQILEKSATFRQ